MNLNCSNCEAEVPEGAIVCPRCKAGIGTVMFGRKKGLTRTMIGKAIELRTAIPWASASAVILIDDGHGNKKVSRGRLAVLALVLVAGVTGAVLWLRGSSATAAMPELTAEVTTPAQVASTKPASSNRKKPNGTLNVNALHRGKPISARVYVNGEDKGMTPVAAALAPGKYTLKIQKAGFKTEKRTDVLVRSNRTAVLKVDLRK